jgi:hypothetical protein
VVASAFQLFGSGIEKINDGTILLESHTLKGYLARDTYTPDLNAHDELADLGANEASNYTRPTISGASVSRVAGVTKFDCNDISVTAAGGNCVAQYLVLYDDDVAGDPLIGLWSLDTTPAEITILNGLARVFVIGPAGVFTAQQA